ncbi:MAG: 30S ribosomal protein S2 [Alcanivoracaceae bacterium]|nr:30S ribosomal protein S2 [Alcanivoracaceae bacterium]
MANVSIKQLLEAGVHFGHNTRYWNPKMDQYIFSTKNKIHIIDLSKTERLMQDALNYISSLASRRGKILFVGTKRSASKVMKQEAIRCGMPYVTNRWLGGMMTNYQTVKKSINRIREIETMKTDGRMEKLIKKEQLKHERELIKLEKSLGGIKDMAGVPDAMFIVDTKHESIAIKEAKTLGIPVIAIVDTNNSFEGVDYIIPGNDDAMKAINLYSATVADAVLEGRASMPSPADAEKVKKEAMKKAEVLKEEVPKEEAAKEEVAKEEKVEAPKEEVKEVTEEAAVKTTKKKVTKKKVVSKKVSKED